MKKKINKLGVKITKYRTLDNIEVPINLDNLEVPENIYNGLHKLCESGIWVDYCDDESMKALKWLEDNIDVVKEIEIEAGYDVKEIY